jgi:hypothetical protein
MRASASGAARTAAAAPATAILRRDNGLRLMYDLYFSKTGK